MDERDSRSSTRPYGVLWNPAPDYQKAVPTPNYPAEDDNPACQNFFQFPSASESTLVTPPSFDTFVDSPKVLGLVKNNFWPFLNQKDVTLVMFYDPRIKDTELVSDEFRQAAGCTKRPNHAFAAVNCKKERDLCKLIGVIKTPVFRLYSAEVLVNSITDSKKNAANLRSLVEKNPVSALK